MEGSGKGNLFSVPSGFIIFVLHQKGVQILNDPLVPNTVQSFDNSASND